MLFATLRRLVKANQQIAIGTVSFGDEWEKIEKKTYQNNICVKRFGIEGILQPPEELPYSHRFYDVFSNRRVQLLMRSVTGNNLSHLPRVFSRTVVLRVCCKPQARPEICISATMAQDTQR